MDESTAFYVEISRALIRAMTNTVQLPNHSGLGKLLDALMLAIEGNHYVNRMVSLIRTFFFKCDYTSEEINRYIFCSYNSERIAQEKWFQIQIKYHETSVLPGCRRRSFTMTLHSSFVLHIAWFEVVFPAQVPQATGWGDPVLRGREVLPCDRPELQQGFPGDRRLGQSAEHQGSDYCAWVSNGMWKDPRAREETLYLPLVWCKEASKCKAEIFLSLFDHSCPKARW